MRRLLIFCLFGLWACEPKAVTAETTSDTLVVAEERAALADSFAMPPPAEVREELPEPEPEMAPSGDVNTNGVEPEKLVSFAEKLIGIPYVYASSDPKVGFDCSGFITYVFNNFGIRVPRSSRDFTNVGQTIAPGDAKRGDIILFTGTNPLERSVGHMGIVVSNTDTLKFIHSTSGRAMGVTITPLNAGYTKRFVRTLRVFPQLNGSR